MAEFPGMHCTRLALYPLIFLFMGNLVQGGEGFMRIPLWSSGVPGALTTENVEVVTPVEGGNIHITGVIHPEILVYLPESDTPTPAVVICPGGGYRFLSFHKEGTTPAEFLARKGIAGIVLKYRLPDKDLQEDPRLAPLRDAQRALQIVRQRAKEWNIDPGKIGIMGFSAGGHLAASAGSHWRSPVVEDASPEEVRPDFNILVYPVISFVDPQLVHSGSMGNLLGENPSRELLWSFSAEKRVDAKTPPAFLVHAMDDQAVPVDNSLQYLKALRDAGVAGEGIFYQTGGHGFGMNQGHPDSWPEQMIRWIRLNLE